MEKEIDGGEFIKKTGPGPEEENKFITGEPSRLLQMKYLHY